MPNEKIYTTKDGFRGNIKEMAKHYGINRYTLGDRIRISTNIDEAIKYCIEHKRKIYITSDGFEGTIGQIAKHYNINRETLANRINSGMPIDEAIKYEPFKIYTTFDGFTGNLTQIAKHYGIDQVSLYSSLKKNATIDEAIEYCVKHKRTVKVYTTQDGFTGSVPQIAKYYNMNKNIIYNRLKKGMTIDESIIIPLQKIKNLKYKGETGDLRYFCKKYDKDFVEVYNKLKNLKTLKYALESTDKPYQE